MKKLTEFQKNFFLEYFFKNENFPGWKNIAIELLDKGYCVVAGQECIWKGGIGNFIKTQNDTSFINCLLYEFDLKNFISSLWYRETVSMHQSLLFSEKKEIEIKYKQTSELLKI